MARMRLTAAVGAAKNSSVTFWLKFCDSRSGTEVDHIGA